MGTASHNALFRAAAVLSALTLVAAPPLAELSSAQAGRDRDAGPPPVERTPDAPPWPKDFEIGLEAARAFAYYFGIVESDSLLARVTEIGYRVASQTGHPEYLYTFNILDVDDPNALALPGGFIFITRGMLEQDLSDAALAHLLGHELAHVTERHFARAERVESLLSLLQTAVLVAALVAVPASGSGGYDYDEEAGAYRRSSTGKAAALEGTTIFGGLFRELLVRGYGRGLELDADRLGRRFASRAGYPMRGGVELMSTLKDRIYEDQEYGYWRTHPYFEDRVIKARAASDPGGAPPNERAIDAYRTEFQQRMAALAGTIKNDDLAIFLYDSALRIHPGAATGIEIGGKKLDRALSAERRKPEILRSYTPVVAEYDSLLAAAKELGGAIPETQARRLATARDELVLERDRIYPDARARAQRPEAGIHVLETFLQNFPEDSLAVPLRFRLAEQYRMSGRADEAALELEHLWAELSTAPEPDEAEVERSLAMLEETLPETKELITNERLIRRSRSDSVRTWAGSQLERLATGLDSLEIGSRFLSTYPRSDQAETVRTRVEELARARYLQARLHESLGAYQQALDGYHQVVLLAPGTTASDQSRAGIDRIQARAGR